MRTLTKAFLGLAALILLAGPVLAHGPYGHVHYQDPRFSVTAVTFRLPVEQQVATYATYNLTPLQALPTAAVFRVADPCPPQVQQVQQVQAPQTYQVSDPAPQTVTYYRTSDPGTVNYYSTGSSVGYTVGLARGYTYNRDPALFATERFRGGIHGYAGVIGDPRLATFERRTEVDRRGLFGSTRTVTDTRTLTNAGFRGGSSTFERQTTTVQHGPLGGVRAVQTTRTLHR